MAGTEQEKLRVLVPHWIEHNVEHAAEFRNWAQKARAAGGTSAAEEIEAAAKKLEEANAALGAALQKLETPV